MSYTPDPHALEVGIGAGAEGYSSWCSGHELPIAWDHETIDGTLGHLLSHVYTGHHGRPVQMHFDHQAVRHLAMSFMSGELARRTVHR